MEEGCTTQGTCLSCSEYNLKTLRVFYTNADSLKNKVKELETRALLDKPEIIIVTEALPKFMLGKLQECELKMLGYSLITNFEDNQCKRGIAVYYNHEISVNINELRTEFNEALKLDISNIENDILEVLVVYRSPHSSDDNNKAMLEMIKDECRSSGRNFILIGDFNLGKINWDNLQAVGCARNSLEQKFIEQIMDCFLIQHTSEATRIREGQKPSMLDLVFSKEETTVEGITYHEPLGSSDHVLMNLSINTSLKGVLTEEKLGCYRFNRGDYDAMRKELADYNWKQNFLGKSLEGMWDIFSNKIKNVTDKWVPKVKKITRERPLWMNSEVLQAIAEKKKTWNKLRYIKSESNLIRYKRARNLATSKIRDAQRELETKISREIKTQPKSFWRYIRSRTSVRDKIDELRYDGEVFSSDEEKAECLNTYFASVFTQDENTPTPKLENRAEKTITKFVVDEVQIFNKLQALKVDKSAGPDNLFPRVLAECKKQLSYPLYEIFRASVEQGVLPLEWKKATVVPIFKKGSRKDPANYRPVSLTSVVGKILEAIIRDQLMDHLECQGLLSDEQFGFIKGRSCALQLLKVVDFWNDSLDEGHNTDVFYTDFRKAFDSVSHKRLLSKLEAYGVEGDAYSWIAEFLDNRAQAVKVRNVMSKPVPVASGVPQGSVLGPALFLVFINDIVDQVEHGRLMLFADDAKKFQEVDVYQHAVNFQNDINSLTEWADHWKLEFNVSKCKIMHLGKTSLEAQYYMEVDKCKIPVQEVESEKDLGVRIDSGLNFKLHIGEVVRKANRMLGLVRRSFKFVTQDVFLNLYKTLIRPLLEYCSCVWSPSTVAEIRLLEGVQRRATKMISDLKPFVYETRLKMLGLPTLEYRRKRADMIQIFRIFQGIDRYGAHLPFTQLNENRTRGHQFKIEKKRCHKTKRMRSFAFRVVDVWNKLPGEVVNTPSLNCFKSRLNNHWLKHPLKFRPSFM